MPYLSPKLRAAKAEFLRVAKEAQKDAAEWHAAAAADMKQADHPRMSPERRARFHGYVIRAQVKRAMASKLARECMGLED